MSFNPTKLQAFLKTKSTAATAARTGGKGTVRRKHKIIRKAATHDDKRLKTTLNKLNVRDIPAIEEVNLFKDDGTVVHFAAPKVQASIAANTYVVSGNAETKKLQDLLPGIINQLGPDNLEDLKKIYATYSQAEPPKAGEDEEDEVPELVSNFEDVSDDKEKDTKAEPAKAEPVKTEPAKAEPTKVEPVKTEATPTAKPSPKVESAKPGKDDESEDKESDDQPAKEPKTKSKGKSKSDKEKPASKKVSKKSKEEGDENIKEKSKPKSKKKSKKEEDEEEI